MNKTPQKITDCVETPRRGRQNYMNEIKKSILNDVKKIILNNVKNVVKILTMQAIMLQMLSTLPPTLILMLAQVAVLPIVLCVLFA